jgi:lysophospholipase L1-like esterase
MAQNTLRLARVVIVAGSGPLLTLLGCTGVAPLVPDPAVRYVAFGDSSTAGTGGEQGYPELLAALLGEPLNAIANQGTDGESTADGLERVRELIERGIYPNAEVLLYWEGGADLIALMRELDRLLLFSPRAADYPFAARLEQALDRIAANVEAAITAGQAAGLTVYVATYFSLREATTACDPLPLDVIVPAQARNANDYVDLLNERIRAAATRTGAGLVDIAAADAALQADAANFVNCNHLSSQGNAIVAEIFRAALQ